MLVNMPEGLSNLGPKPYEVGCHVNDMIQYKPTMHAP